MTIKEQLKTILDYEIEAKTRKGYEELTKKLFESEELDSQLQQARNAIWQSKHGKDAPSMPKDKDNYNPQTDIQLRMKVVHDSIRKVEKLPLDNERKNMVYREIANELHILANDLDSIFRIALKGKDKGKDNYTSAGTYVANPSDKTVVDKSGKR